MLRLCFYFSSSVFHYNRNVLIWIFRFRLIYAFGRFDSIPIDITAFFGFFVDGNGAGHDAGLSIIQFVQIQIDVFLSRFGNRSRLIEEYFIIEIIFNFQTVFFRFGSFYYNLWLRLRRSGSREYMIFDTDIEIVLILIVLIYRTYHRRNS